MHQAALDLEGVPKAIRSFVEAFQGRPDFAAPLRPYAVSTPAAKLEKSEAAHLAARLRRIAPGNPYVQTLTKSAIRRCVPFWHSTIIRAERRNAVYDQALRSLVTPETTVLEIGTGSGIFAMMAAHAGARHVYTIEMEPVIAAAARENIRRNGYADKITVINRDAAAVSVSKELPRRCDLFVRKIMSNDLLAERVLLLVIHARAELLTPDVLHLSDRIEVRGLLISEDRFLENLRVGTQAGFDLSAIDALAVAVGLRNPPIRD